jgi:hypothetical protein
MEVNQLSEHTESATGKVVHNKEIFHVMESCCHVDRWTVNFKHSKHDTLYEVLSSLFSSKIKKHFEELVVGKAKDFAELFNHRIYVLYNEARLKQEELSYLAELKKNEALEGLADARADLKESLLHSAPAEALKEKAKEKGIEALKTGFQRVKDGDLTSAISQGLGDIKESIQNTDLLSGLTSESADKSKTQSRPVRSDEPLPAASFVSTEGESTLGNVRPSAKYPSSVVAPQKKSPFSPDQ